MNFFLVYFSATEKIGKTLLLKYVLCDTPLQTTAKEDGSNSKLSKHEIFQ
jgi:hypothetical protein